MNYRQGISFRKRNNVSYMEVGTFCKQKQLGQAMIFLDKSRSSNIHSDIVIYQGCYTSSKFSGIVKTKNSIYKGQMVANQRNKNDKQKHACLFEFGQGQGLGLLKTSSYVYKGAFVDGKKQGYGVWIIHINIDQQSVGKLGCIFTYKGHFYQDERCGSGIYQDKYKRICGTWSGDWVSGQATKYYIAEIKIYVGTFRNGLQQGFGSEIRVIFANQVRQQGQFNLDENLESGIVEDLQTKLCGQLIFGQVTFLSSVTIQVGSFVNGFFQGQGSKTQYGMTYHGNLRQSQQFGSGFMIDDNLNVQICGSWLNDRVNGDTSIYIPFFYSFFIGHCIEGLQRGIGTLLNFRNKSRKNGYFNNNVNIGNELFQDSEQMACGQPSRGQGTQIMQDQIYAGELINYLNQGLGIKYSCGVDQWITKGYFDQDYISSYGILLAENKIALGRFSKGLLNGQATVVTFQNQINVGGFLNNNQHGPGINLDSTKQVCMKGISIQGQLDGIGLYSIGDTLACGQFRGKSIHGQAFVKFLSGGFDIGNFESDCLNGLSLRPFSEEKHSEILYAGQWNDSRPKDQLQLIIESAIIRKGYFYSGGLHGVMISQSNRLFECGSFVKSSGGTALYNSLDRELYIGSFKCGVGKIFGVLMTQTDMSSSEGLVLKIQKYHGVYFNDKPKGQGIELETTICQYRDELSKVITQKLQLIRFRQECGKFDIDFKQGTQYLSDYKVDLPISLIKEQFSSNNQMNDSQLNLLRRLKQFRFQDNEICHVILQGEFENGLIKEKGIERTQCDQYEGYFQKGQRHGEGIMITREFKKAIVNEGHKTQFIYLIREVQLHKGYFKNNIPVGLIEFSIKQYLIDVNQYLERYSPTMYQDDDPFVQKLQNCILLRSEEAEQIYDHNQVILMKSKAIDGFQRTMNILPGGKITGIITTPQSEYKGEIENNEPHGYGDLLTTMESYCGYFKHGRFHGHGLFIDKIHKFQYKGDFKDHKYNGYGVMTDYYGVKYEGYWQNGLKHGYGVMTDANKNKYEGQFLNGHFQDGFGKLTQVNGTIYEGNWVNGAISGHGKAIFDDGSIYEGNWKKDEPKGQGVYIWYISWQQYKQRLFSGLIRSPMPIMGDTFKDELYVHLQSQNLENSHPYAIEIKQKYQYKGYWRNGQFNGSGELSAEGVSYKGEFKDHLMHGIGTLTINSVESIGQWDHGILIVGQINLNMIDQDELQAIPYWVE